MPDAAHFGEQDTSSLTVHSQPGKRHGMHSGANSVQVRSPRKNFDKIRMRRHLETRNTVGSPTTTVWNSNALSEEHENLKHQDYCIKQRKV